jgi:glucose-6-phosphate 1-dehydrogenase
VRASSVAQRESDLGNHFPRGTFRHTNVMIGAAGSASGSSRARGGKVGFVSQRAHRRLVEPMTDDRPATSSVTRDPQRRNGARRGQPTDPCTIVIFGASGDLSKRKLFPAILNLRRSGLLPDQFAVLGLATSEMTSEAFRARLDEGRTRGATESVDAALWGWLLERTEYLPGDFRSPELYSRLQDRLREIEGRRGTGGNVVFYLATPPDFFGDIVDALAAAGLTKESGASFRRVIVEKPFGDSHDSARRLNARLRQTIDEQQIYRIDHYLGKETVQNLLVFRFANGIFEPIWNRLYIDNVQITVAETVGVEQRGRYYDTAGALRDMVPNHLFQLLALTAMEPPSSFEAESVRDEKIKVLRAIQPLTPEEVLTRTVRGQYGAGDDPEHVAYRAENRVDPRSDTETYVALKLFIDNWRWADVPFYLRTGKRLALAHTDITITFRRPPHRLFEGTEVAAAATPNILVLHLQPDEGISLRFQAKVPGPIVRTGTVDMAFNYGDHFGRTPSTGYETLLYDCICGDPTLFQRADSVEDGWSVVEPILDVWRALPARSFPNYASGSWGPQAAEELLARDGRSWVLSRREP